MTAFSHVGLKPLRVDQIGSLRRPTWLLDTRVRLAAGQATSAELKAAEDRAIREVVAQQETMAFPVVTDGELRRTNFMDSFGASVTGYPQGGASLFERVPTREPLRLVHNLPLEEYEFTRTLTDRPVKVTILGPDRITARFEWETSQAVYPDVQAFVNDVITIERQMVGGLVAAGCPYVQIDAPGYTNYLDPAFMEPLRARGEDPMTNFERSLRADNAVIAGFPDTEFGIHLCRGNRPGGYRRSGGYDAIAERLFNTLNHDRFLLEYDTERAGGFEPLRFVPRGKVVVLGLVSTKVPELETAEYLTRRVMDASKYLPLEQLALSPQCGFGGGDPARREGLSEDEQWRKLELVQRVAAEVWG